MEAHALRLVHEELRIHGSHIPVSERVSGWKGVGGVCVWGGGGYAGNFLLSWQ